MDYEIIILKTGFTEALNDAEFIADGTITLIKAEKNIIVDTGGPWDREFLINALKEIGLTIDTIDYVICTHGHSDHIGNINLFNNATIILSNDILKNGIYTYHNFQQNIYKIDDNIEIHSTPGHTSNDISVIVKSGGKIYGIVGDLFENENDLIDENLWRDFSEFPDIQRKSRMTIRGLVDYIIPGHGNIFKVK